MRRDPPDLLTMEPTTHPPRPYPTRREFLGTAAAALAAGATVSSAAAVAPSPDAAPGATSSTRPAGGRDGLRVAVIGTGARGSDLIRALTTIDGARIVG